MKSQKFFAGVKVGERIKIDDGLFIFPLLLEDGNGEALQYDLLDEAIEKGYVEIDEKKIPEVSTIVVNVKEEKDVLVVEGEVLEGGLQTRTVNISLLLNKGENLIPVSCVEQGRWGNYRVYNPADFLVDNILRTRKVATAFKNNSFRADQDAVWRHTAMMMERFDALSDTESYEEIFVKKGSDIKRNLEDVEPVDGQVGAVIVINGEVVGVDMFDKPETWKKLSKKVLGSYYLSWSVSEKESHKEMTENDVEKFLSSLDKIKPEVKKPPVGVGEHYFIEKGKIHGFALVKDGKVVHLFVGVERA
jgi:hypothetical protein